jgi:DNA-binding response OmpR family regulator
LDAVAARAPDLIVLDWHLPELDGIQTCRALREHSAVPIVMASGNRANSKEMALAAGATDYLPKPFSIGELLLCIEAALGKPNS